MRHFTFFFSPKEQTVWPFCPSGVQSNSEDTGQLAVTAPGAHAV